MDTHNENLGESRTINFPNNRSVRVLSVSKDAMPLDILRAIIARPPKAVIVIAGGAGNMDKNQMRRLAPFFSLGIARAAKNLNALVIDGGTQAGVMELMGKGVADQGYEVELMGVAPSGRVTLPGAPLQENAQDLAGLDPNHTKFILVKGDNWGDETAMMYSLAQTLYQGRLEEPVNGRCCGGRLPTVTILAGGRIGGIAMKEAQTTVHMGWPLVVMEGSGQLADEIAGRYRSYRVQNKIRSRFSRLGLIIRRWLSPELREADAFIDEIIEDGQIVLASLDGKPSDFEKLLASQLKEKPGDSILLRAWRRFAVYDQNASRHQGVYRRLKSWPLILGVLATALVLLNQFLTNPPVTNPPLLSPFDKAVIQTGDPVHRVLNFLIIMTPLIVALFLSADRLFKSGTKWLLLRYYAEEIKGDIYSYRVLSALNRHPKTDFPDEATELSARMTQASRRLMRTEVNESALAPYIGPIPPVMYGAAARDDGVSPLDPETYADIRINDQINYYTLKTNKLEKQLQPRQWLILVFGTLGSLLAALGGAFQFWVPLTVALVSALTAYLEYQQVEQSVIKYNQSLTKLANLADWWVALSPGEKKAPKNIVRLVEETERIMKSEHLGWAQQMQTTQEGSAKTETPPEEEEPASEHQLEGMEIREAEQPQAREVATPPDGH